MGARFKGWSTKDILDLGSGSLRDEHVQSAKSRKKRAQGTGSGGARSKQSTAPDYVGMISAALMMLHVKHVREHRFSKTIGYRFDIAIPELKIAVEFEGGIFSGGAHTRGKGYAKDCRKYNLAELDFWSVLRYTPDDARDLNWEFTIADEIKRFANKKTLALSA